MGVDMVHVLPWHTEKGQYFVICSDLNPFSLTQNLNYTSGSGLALATLLSILIHILNITPVMTE